MTKKQKLILTTMVIALIVVGTTSFVVFRNNSSTKTNEASPQIKTEEPKPINRFENIKKEDAAKEIPILMYHDVIQEDDKSDGNKMPIKVFEEQMKYLKDNGYATITNEEFVAAYEQKINLPEKSVLITFDDGFKSIKNLVEPTLKKYDFKATSFVIGSYISREEWHLTKPEISEIAARKVINFESHTHDLHEYQNKRGLIETTTPQDFKVDNQKQVELLGHKTNIVCYPFGHAQGNATKNLKDSNIPFGFAIAAGSTSNVVLKQDRKNEFDEVQEPHNLPRVRVNADTTINKFQQLIK